MRHRPGRRGVGRALLGLAMACAVGLSVLALVVFYHPPPKTLPPGSTQPPTPYVVVLGYDFVVTYATSNLSDTNYLLSPECPNCPQTLQPGGNATFFMSFTNGDARISHNITGVTINAPFQFQSASPAFPISLGGGQSVSLEVTVHLPAAAGYYTLSGGISTR